MAVQYAKYEVTTIYGDTESGAFSKTLDSELAAKAEVLAAQPEAETITLFNAKGKVNGRLFIQPKEDS